MTAQLRRASAEAEARAAVLLRSMTPLARIRPAVTGRYLVKGILDRGAFSCVFGQSNVGKTFFALDLAIRISAGGEWFGRRIAENAGPAIYIAAEGNAAFGNRIAAFRAANRIIAERAAKAGMLVVPTTLDLVRPEDTEILCDLIADQMDVSPSLIVIDTLARSMGDGDENAGKDMGALVRNCGLLQRRTAAHVMLVHHTGKSEARGMRGHSSLHAALDTEVELARPDQSSRLTAVSVRKQRDLEGGSPFYFMLRRIEIGYDEDGDAVTSAAIEQAAEPDTGRGALAQNEERRVQARGRADAALRLCPAGRDFAAGEVAEAFALARIVRGRDKKSVLESTRAKLNSMAAYGLLNKADGGRFRVLGGEANDA